MTLNFTSDWNWPKAKTPASLNMLANKNNGQSLGKFKSHKFSTVQDSLWSPRATNFPSQKAYSLN
ncbi:hypothetical protein BpHYR1_046946 [Brachionus plicatilis]|uniref:Uncharacterized protein n=1 Tax=Brachionus plicatilis TaxID=10195 RepID=A0A3M7RGJ0_BRAPC|nr:hypothetical protein BpHYR1_046946 [Brachionus plicatilis]